MIPLPVAVPLIAAALLAAFGRRVPRRLADAVAFAAAAFTAVACAILLARARAMPLVYWFGGWRPHGGAALGISFVIDPIGAGLALLSALLIAAALVFSLRYFDTIGALFHVLVLAFLAALCGFSLTGDLFNLFVWFELMGAAGVALCGYKADEEGPLQGALNFGITNTIGAFLVLIGIAILYAKTGALNMAQIARTLGAMHDGSVIAAFALITCGFLVKAAAVPFHFWLPDAHTVAPTPVCVLFSGVMVEAGLYAVVRVFYAVLQPSLAHGTDVLRMLLVVIGAATAVFGALLCFAQRNLKRLLAFSTVSHMGVMILGFGLLSAESLGGTALYVLGHGAVKSALFVGAGAILHRFRSVDELALQGRGRKEPLLGMLMLVGAIGLAGAPPFGTWSGEGLIESAATALGMRWVSIVLILVAIGTAGAVLRATGRIFCGWGPQSPLIADSSQVGGEPSEAPETADVGGVPLTMTMLFAALLAGGIAVGVWPHLRHSAIHFTTRMTDTGGYASLVLDGKPLGAPQVGQLEPHAHGLGRVLGSLACAAVMAAWALRRRKPWPRLAGALAALRRLHSGHVGDYVTWMLVGVGGFGALCALLFR